MKRFSSPSQKIGLIGENIACTYLRNKGFMIVDRNYTQKWGEIDIVANKDNVLHFIEVKSVSCETDGYRPEELVHGLKQGRLIRTIGTYLSEHFADEWRFSIICVYLDMRQRKARVRFLENLIL